MTRLLLCFPRYTMVQGTLVDEVLKIVGGTPVPWVSLTADHNQAFHNMNGMIAKGLSMPTGAWDRAVFIEQDHRFPKNVLQRVAAWPEDAVVGPLYWKHADIGVAVPGHWNADKEVLVPLSRREMDAAGPNLLPIDVLGTCLLSVPRMILHRWPKDEPWFRPEYHGRKLIGYETWFCLMCKKLGIPVYCDLSLEIEHYGWFPVKETLG